MTYITLTSDQAATVRDAVTPVLIHDPQGTVVGVLDRSKNNIEMVNAFTDEEYAQAQREMELKPSGITTAELLQRLESLAPSKPA